MAAPRVGEEKPALAAWGVHVIYENYAVFSCSRVFFYFECLLRYSIPIAFWEGESLISLSFGKVSSLYEHNTFE